jgi:hypothetical protein
MNEMYKRFEKNNGLDNRKEASLLCWVVFWLTLLLVTYNSNAQVSNYTFGNTTGTYTALTSGTTWQSGATLNTDAISGQIPLGFTFRYNNKDYTSIAISNNGYIVFGTDLPAATVSTPISQPSNTATATDKMDGAVAGFGANLVASTRAGVVPSIQYGTNSGDFIVQYTDVCRNGVTGSTGDRFSFQIRLTPTTNVITFVYGAFAADTALSSGIQVGLRGGSYYDWKTLNSTNNTGTAWTNPIVSNTAGTGPHTAGMRFHGGGSGNGSATFPLSGRTYTFTPAAGLGAPTYATIPATESFDSWANGNSTADLPNANNWRSWPGYGDRSWRKHDVAAATAGWSTSTATGQVTVAAPASSGVARFHSNASTTGSTGYLDYYVNFSPAAVKVLTFDYINAAGTDNVKVYLSTDGGATFGSALGTYGVAAAWATQTLVLGSSTSSTAVIRFEATSQLASADIGIDNVAVNLQCTPSVAGSISGATSVCTGTNSTVLTLSGNTGTIQWQSSTDNSIFSDISLATGLTYTANNLSATTYYRVVVTSGACPSATSNTVAITVTTTNTWTGATSTAWTTDANWSCGVAPTSVSDVVIASSTFYPEISSDVVINSLTLNAGTTLKVISAYDLTVTNAIAIGSTATLTLENTANLLQVNNVANTGLGKTVVKRNSSAILRNDYTLWCSPVTGQGLYAFSPTTLPNRFYIYDTASNTYSNSVGFDLTGLQYPSPLVAPNGINGTDTNNVPFALGKSYLIRVPWDHPTAPAVFAGVFSGTANNGNLSYSMSTGYNAVGNPYPSRLNVWNFIDGNPNISGPLYFWRKTNNANNTSYATLTKLAYTQNFATGGDTGTGFFNVGDEANWVINVGQGFIVNATSNANLNFTNGMRRSLNSNQFFRSSQTTTSVTDGIFWLNLSNATLPLSQMAVGYVSDATLGIDHGIDGKNINEDFYLTSLIDNDNYSIQGRPSFAATDIVPLSYNVAVAGNHSISIDHASGIFTSGQVIYLHDILTSTIHNLTDGAYNFTTDAGTFASRFKVIYQPQLGIDNPEFNANQVIVYQNEIKDFIVNSGTVMMSSVKVFDVSGRLLFDDKDVNATQTVIAGGLTNGVLLIQITSQDGLVVTKKVLR